MQGRLALSFGDTPRIDGAIEAETLDAPAIDRGRDRHAGAARRAARRAGRPSRLPRARPELAGRIEFKAQRATIAPGAGGAAIARRGAVRPAEMVFEDVAGELANGRLEGRLAFASGADGLSARVRVALSGAEAGAIVRRAASGRRSPGG